MALVNKNPNKHKTYNSSPFLLVSYKSIKLNYCLACRRLIYCFCDQASVLRILKFEALICRRTAIKHFDLSNAKKQQLVVI